MKLKTSEIKQIIRESLKENENREGKNLDKEEKFQKKLAADSKFKAAYEAEKDPWKKQAMKNKLKEQVGGMTPPSSTFEEEAKSQISKSVAYGVNISELINDIDHLAKDYFANSMWEDIKYDMEGFDLGLEDLRSMALVRTALYNNNVDTALKIYRKCDTGCRDMFPELMWKLSANQSKETQNKRIGVK